MERFGHHVPCVAFDDFDAFEDCDGFEDFDSSEDFEDFEDFDGFEDCGIVDIVDARTRVTFFRFTAFCETAFCCTEPAARSVSRRLASAFEIIPPCMLAT